MGQASEYDPRYLRGIELFNDHDYFEAHEVWEELWNDCPADWRRFYQSLIQAAVALYHWGSGNWRGCRRLFHSARGYMAAYPDHFLGLDAKSFWLRMEQALAPALAETPPAPSAKLDRSAAPFIVLAPAPQDRPVVD